MFDIVSAVPQLIDLNHRFLNWSSEALIFDTKCPFKHADILSILIYVVAIVLPYAKSD